MRKTASLGILVFGLGCGDTNEYYVTAAGQDETSAEITCESLAVKLYDCNYKNAQAHDNYIEGAIKECEAGEVLTKFREMAQCYMDSSCENLEACEQDTGW